jgi:hypothetical protein
VIVSADGHRLAGRRGVILHLGGRVEAKRFSYSGFDEYGQPKSGEVNILAQEDDGKVVVEFECATGRLQTALHRRDLTLSASSHCREGLI